MEAMEYVMPAFYSATGALSYLFFNWLFSRKTQKIRSWKIEKRPNKFGYWVTITRRTIWGKDREERYFGKESCWKRATDGQHAGSGMQIVLNGLLALHENAEFVNRKNE